MKVVIFDDNSHAKNYADLCINALVETNDNKATILKGLDYFFANPRTRKHID